jgi:hypothetical protein
MVNRNSHDDTLRLTLLREGMPFFRWGIMNRSCECSVGLIDDNDAAVILNALGSLDALILKQGQSLCTELYRKNIVTLLDKLLDMVAYVRYSEKFRFALEVMMYNVLDRIW